MSRPHKPSQPPATALALRKPPPFLHRHFFRKFFLRPIAPWYESIGIDVIRRVHQTIKQKPSMKNPIRSLALGIALFAATSMVNAQSILTYNATPTTSVSGTTFSFSMFDSGLGTLTAVQLLFNSSTVSGNITLAGNGEDYDFNSASAFVRTFGTGLTNQNTTAQSLSFSPSLPDSQVGSATQVYTLTGSQSLIASALTYNINSLNWSSYLNAGGVGSTPNFTTRLFPSTSISGATPKPTETFNMTAASSYTLRYTYTPSGPVPVPEPGQVAASLLLLGGIGAYYFVKRRRKSAPAAA
jgi:hypothetical protein